MSLDLSPEEHAKALADIMQGLSSAQGAEGLSDNIIEALYESGHVQFSQGRFDQALKVFAVVLLHRPINARFVCAYGMCQKNLHDYLAAQSAFKVQVLLEPENPVPLLHMAECLMMLERKEEAAAVLASVVEMAMKDSTHGQAGAHATAMPPPTSEVNRGAVSDS